ncbi:MAG: hypothetical protein WCI41_03535 [bacterium]
MCDDLKGKLWDKKVKEFDKKNKNLLQYLDEGIRETVVALNLLGFPTIQSCEAHLDHGSPGPWVMIAAKNEPAVHFKKEKEVFKRIAKENNLKVKDIVRPIDDRAFELWKVASLEYQKSERMPLYKKWEEKNDVLYKKLWDICKEFYSSHNKKLDKNTTLNLMRGMNFIRFFNGKKDDILQEKGKVVKLKKSDLKKRQEEMRLFTNFLKNKYLNS